MSAFWTTATPNLLQSVFDNVGAALLVIDSEGRLVFVNRAFATLFGEDLGQAPIHVKDRVRLLLAQGYRFQDCHGKEQVVDGSQVMRVLAGEQVQSRDFRVIFPDGNWKWIHFSAHRFSIVGLTGVLVIATDETVQVELRNTVARLDRLETLGTLARALAHDFNNILDVISSNAHLALSDTCISETTRASLQSIPKASQEATELVRRLMLLGRTPPPETRTVQINDLITGVLQMVRPLLRDGIHVKTNLRRDLPMVDADPVEIDRLLVNLIVNAIDAMPQGGELVISTEVEQLDETGPKSAQPRRPFVFISVSDTGVGIPSSVQSKIFQPFFTTKQEGTGLGLWSVYGTVQQHGGDIKVCSEPHKGTKFTVSLPLK